MKLILRLTAALQAIAAYLSATLPSLLTLLKKLPAVLRGGAPDRTGEQTKRDE